MANVETNISDLQKRLNSDPKLKAAFLKDPSKVLSDEGIKVTPKEETRITDAVNAARKATPGGADPAAIKVSIGVDF